MTSLAEIHPAGLHALFQQLINALDSLPTNCASGDAIPTTYDLRDDGTALLRAMDRVLGTGNDTDLRDTPNASDNEDEHKVCLRHPSNTTDFLLTGYPAFCGRESGCPCTKACG